MAFSSHEYIRYFYTVAADSYHEVVIKLPATKSLIVSLETESASATFNFSGFEVDGDTSVATVVSGGCSRSETGTVSLYTCPENYWAVLTLTAVNTNGTSIQFSVGADVEQVGGGA